MRLSSDLCKTDSKYRFMESNANQRKTNMSGKLVEFEETLQVLASLVSRGVSNSRQSCWRAPLLLCWCIGPDSGFFLRAERYPVC